MRGLEIAGLSCLGLLAFGVLAMIVGSVGLWSNRDRRPRRDVRTVDSRRAQRDALGRVTGTRR